MDAAYPRAYFTKLNSTASPSDGLGALVGLHESLQSRAQHWRLYWLLQMVTLILTSILFLTMLYVNKSLSAFQSVMVHNSMDIFMVLFSIFVTAIGLAFLMLLNNNQVSECVVRRLAVFS